MASRSTVDWRSYFSTRGEAPSILREALRISPWTGSTESEKEILPEWRRKYDGKVTTPSWASLTRPSRKVANSCPVFVIPGRLVGPDEKPNRPEEYTGSNELIWLFASSAKSLRLCFPWRVEKLFHSRK
jgi:hypothetical protein